MKNTRHFKLTSETTVSILGTTLFRVELTIDCAFGKKGDKGGFVEKEENLQGNKAWLYNNAQIEGGGEIWGGEIRGGEIWGGVILGGVIRGGVIRGGVIRGGVIWGGVIRGGVIWVGVIWGGAMWGSGIEGGVRCKRGRFG